MPAHFLFILSFTLGMKFIFRASLLLIGTSMTPPHPSVSPNQLGSSGAQVHLPTPYVPSILIHSVTCRCGLPTECSYMRTQSQSSLSKKPSPIKSTLSLLGALHACLLCPITWSTGATHACPPWLRRGTGTRHHSR